MSAKTLPTRTVRCETFRNVIRALQPDLPREIAETLNRRISAPPTFAVSLQSSGRAPSAGAAEDTTTATAVAVAAARSTTPRRNCLITTTRSESSRIVTTPGQENKRGEVACTCPSDGG